MWIGVDNFINAYKKLEKICNDKYNTKHGVSLYIEEMSKHPDGFKYVPIWNGDLKQLKHYRWLRNKIVHEVDADEEKLCKKSDETWINNFTKSLINNKDPLSLYKQHKSKSISKMFIVGILLLIIVSLIFFTLSK